MFKKSFITVLIVAVAALALLGSAVAGAATSKASTTRVVPIVMSDPGCHFFKVHGKLLVKLTVNGKTSFRNLDEAALVVKSKGYSKLVVVGKVLTIAKPGVYQITMVKQHADDNHLVLTVR